MIGWFKNYTKTIKNSINPIHNNFINVSIRLNTNFKKN